jgi:hypothetical protein
MSSVLINGGLPPLNVSSNSQWMEIQRNTFKNWVNEQLKSRGLSVFDLRTDFADGVLLVALVEILQRKKLPGAVQQPSHNHEKLHNITLALDSIAKDNVTLINIGKFARRGLNICLVFVYETLQRPKDYKTDNGNQSQISSICLAEMVASRHFSQSDP